jgi:hypothetical protein
MANPKKCANAICTCLALNNKKYCSDHCEGIGSKMEIFCLCGHADCGVATLPAGTKTELDTRAQSPGGPAAQR